MINEIYYHKVTIHCPLYNTTAQGTIIREGNGTMDVSLEGTSFTFKKQGNGDYIADKCGVKFIIKG